MVDSYIKALVSYAAENGMIVEILHDLSGNARVAVLKG